jgi:hypothetical protein
MANDTGSGSSMGVSTRAEKVCTVRNSKILFSAILLASKQVLNFFDPFLKLFRKAATDFTFLMLVFLLYFFFAYKTGDWSRNCTVPVKKIPIS